MSNSAILEMGFGALVSTLSSNMQNWNDNLQLRTNACMELRQS